MMADDHPNKEQIVSVGMQAPDFRLQDSDGTYRRLSSVAGVGNCLMFVLFYRGDW